MINPYPCPSCNGVGCANCNNIGFFGRDENYDYYLAKGPGGDVVVAGIKQSGTSKNALEQIVSFFLRIVTRQLEEPHDLIWAIRQRRK